MPEDEYFEMIEQVDILFLTGGATTLRGKFSSNWVTSPYQDRVFLTLKFAKEIQTNQNRWLQVLGTCLGLESMVIAFSENDPNALESGFDDISRTHPLIVNLPNFEKSRYYPDQSRSFFFE